MNDPTQKPPDDGRDKFLESAREEERDLIAEFWMFMAENKMWWLTPILIVFLLVGVLLVISATPLGAWVYSFV